MVQVTDTNLVIQNTFETVTLFHKLLVVWDFFFLLIMPENFFI